MHQLLLGQPSCLGLSLRLGPVKAASKLGDFPGLSPDNRPAVGKAIYYVFRFTNIDDAEGRHVKPQLGTQKHQREPCANQHNRQETKLHRTSAAILVLGAANDILIHIEALPN